MEFTFRDVSRNKGAMICTGKFNFVLDVEMGKGRTKWKCDYRSGKCPANIHTVNGNVVLVYDKHIHKTSKKKKKK